MLIKCPECGKEISDKASACIHCGCPISKQDDTTAQKSQLDLAPIIALYKSGNKLQAVKDLTERTGMSLKEAKEYLDKLSIENNATAKHPNEHSVNINGYNIDLSQILQVWKSGNKSYAATMLRHQTNLTAYEALDYLSKLTGDIPSEKDRMSARAEEIKDKNEVERGMPHIKSVGEEKAERVLQNTNVMGNSVSSKRCYKCGAVYPATDSQCPSCKGLGAQADLIIDNPQAVIEKLKKRYDTCKKTVTISSIVSLVMFFLTMALLVFLATEGVDSTILIILLVLIFILPPICVFVTSASEKTRLSNDIELAQKDFEAYKRLVIEREQKHDAEMAKMMQEQQQANIRKHPTCPMCGSNNTSVIGKLDKNVSFMLWGVGTDKVGKQYQCKTCHHKW